ncbi:hypothetical protein AOLI_G00142590 [Acnodon oligacanthus]
MGTFFVQRLLRKKSLADARLLMTFQNDLIALCSYCPLGMAGLDATGGSSVEGEEERKKPEETDKAEGADLMELNQKLASHERGSGRLTRCK